MLLALNADGDTPIPSKMYDSSGATLRMDMIGTFKKPICMGAFYGLDPCRVHLLTFLVMTLWNGKHYEGAMRAHREDLRTEAEERTKHVKLVNTRRYRLASKEEREAMVRAHAAQG